MGERSGRRAWAALALVLGVGASDLPPGAAVWVANGALATSSFAAAPDWLAPIVGTTVVAKATGYLTGAIKPGGTYYVYASATDDGNPASGVATETADMSLITPGGSSASLGPGAYSVGGVAYTHRSSLLTAETSLAAGPRTYSITSRDAAGNTRTQSGYSVLVDITAPAGSNIQTANVVGGVNGRAEPACRRTWSCGSSTVVASSCS